MSKVHYWQARGWSRVACGSCGGHGMVSDYSTGDFEGPKECDDCGGGGAYWVHRESGLVALWPGGPWRGRLPAAEVERELRAEEATDAR